MDIIILTFLVYVIGVVLSLCIIHRFKKELCIDHYDDKKTYATQDDYDSNAQAYLTFGLTWPFFWIIQIFRGVYNVLLWVSKKFERK